MVTENAAAALSRIIAFHQHAVNAAQLWPVWLANMPVVCDDEEAPHMAAMLLTLIDGYAGPARKEAGADGAAGATRCCLARARRR
jgi:hypothetical protein